MATTVPAGQVRRASALAIPFLGLLGAIQGSAPNISSTALVGASRGLDMVGATLALGSSMQTMAIAASVISTGLLADRLGRRRVLIAALVVGALGQIIVAAALAPWMFLAGQAVTGIGLGALYGAAFAYIRVMAKPGQMAGAVGLFTAVIGIATLVLTFVGGALSSLDWRAAYLVVPAVILLLVFLVPVILPAEPTVGAGKQDILGQVLLGVGIIAFLYGISQLGRSLTSPQTLGPLLLGIALWIAFYLLESRRKNAFFPVELFKHPLFIAAILAGFVYNFGMAVAFLQVTNLWQYVDGLKTLEVSFWQLPLTASGIVSALLFGRLMSKGMSNRTAFLIGGATTVVGYVFLALAHNSSSLLGFLPGLLITGAGVIICAIPFGNLVLKLAPPAYFGPVTSSRTTFGQLFYSVGFALATVAVNKLTEGGTVRRLEEAGVAPNQIGTALDAVTAYAAQSTAPETSLGKQALSTAIESYANSFSTVMLLAAALIAIATAVGVLLMRGDKETTEPAHA